MKTYGDKIRIDDGLYAEIRAYLADNFIPVQMQIQMGAPGADYYAESSPLPFEHIPKAESSLEYRVSTLDESFTEMLMRKIAEEGITDSECYRMANIDRKHFSKIRNDPSYSPKKTTAFAFAIALRLSLEETKELLGKAGYAVSHSSKLDVIVEYFIVRNNYNIFEINDALFSFDQPLLGV